MVLNKIPTVGRFEMYKGVEYINAAIEAAENAKSESGNALLTANNAETVANQTQQQIDNLILSDGTSDAEVVQARGEHGLLYERFLNNELQLEKNVNNLNSRSINVMFPPVPLVGAKADGTDEWQTIQNLMDYCFNNNINDLFFPSGDFLTSKPLVQKTKQVYQVNDWWDGNALTLLGQNKGNTRIIKTTNETLTGVHAEVDGVDATIITFSAEKPGGELGSSATGIGVRGICVENNSTSNTSYAMTGKACQRMIIDDSNFKGHKGLYFPGMFSSNLSNIVISCAEEALNTIGTELNCTSNTFKNIYSHGAKNPYIIRSDYSTIDLLYADDATGTVFNLCGLGLKAGTLGTESPKAQYIVTSNFPANAGGVEVESLYLFRQLGDASAGLSPANCAIFNGNGKITASNIFILEQQEILSNSYIYNGSSIIPSSFELGKVTYYKNYTGTDNPKLLMTKTMPQADSVGKFIGDGSMVNIRRNNYMPFIGSRSSKKTAQFPFLDKAIYLDNVNTTQSSTSDLQWENKYNTGDILLLNDPLGSNCLGFVVTGVSSGGSFVRDNTFSRISILLVGTTAQRPTTNLFIGLEFKDTTLQKTITWWGSNWKDAMGNVV